MPSKFVDVTVMKRADTYRSDELVHQAVGLLAFVSLNQTGQVEHGVHVQVPPLVLRFPIKRTVRSGHRVAVSEIRFFFAVSFRIRQAELDFRTDTRCKPLTDTDIEIGRKQYPLRFHSLRRMRVRRSRPR